MAPNIALSLTERMTLLQSATNICLPLGVFWLLLSLSRKIGRTVWLTFPLMFIGAFQIVLLGLYGKGVIAVDMYLNVVTTNSTEAGELLAGLIPPIILVVAIYLPPLVAAGVVMARLEHLGNRIMWCSRRVAFPVLALGIILLGLCIVSPTPYRPLRQLYPVNALYNLALAVDRTAAQRGYPASAEGFSFASTCAGVDNDITIVVVGETSRASSWQLFGYDRPTTPRLAAADGIIPFPRTLSQSNTTHKSVPLMLSHLRADQFADSIYHVRGIATAFREAGIPTRFISCQDRNGALIDCFGLEADSATFLADRLGHTRNDLDILPRVVEALDSRADGPMLLLIHSYGSHYCYSDRYPDSLAIFHPDRPLEAEVACRPALINAYDNTIRLTDRFLASIISAVEARGLSAALIFTSDHGEDIYDDPRHLFLHASPVPSFEQLHVPMILWMSTAYRQRHPDRFLAAVANSRRPVASSSSVFPTALMLGNIISPRLDPTLSLVSNRYAPLPYTYLDDHNEALSPVDAGLDPIDIARIDSLYTSPLRPSIAEASAR